MSTILYRNQYNNIITFSQAASSNYYLKQTILNNRIKKEEHYEDGRLFQIDYFLSINESANDIRDQFPDIIRVLYMNEIINGEYRKYDVETFDESGNLAGKRIEVFDDKFYPIYDQAVNLVTNATILCKKYYYDESHQLTFEFSYDVSSGAFISLTIYDPTNYVDTEDRTLYPEDIGNNLYDFSWQGFEYYQSASPIIPGVIT